MTDAALIDVILPVFNSEATIESSVRSIQDQSLRDIRIIVVDDGSTDSTPDILSRIAAQDDRVVVERKANGGVVDALNRGISISRAPFIARHDADDLAFSDRLKKQSDYLTANRDCIAVSCNAWHIDAEGNRLGTRTNFAGNVHPDPTSIPSREPHLMHPFLMVRRHCLVTAGGYRYAYHSEDTDLYWRLHQEGRLYNLSDVLGEYRIHQGGVSGASIRNGRLSSIYSQLAAVSYCRRIAGRPDIEFPRIPLADLDCYEDLESLIKLFEPNLAIDEYDYLELATAAKLLENATYRAYKLELSDCNYIRRAVQRSGIRMRPQEKRDLYRNQAALILRYCRGGGARQIAALHPSAEACVRAAWQLVKELTSKGHKA